MKIFGLHITTHKRHSGLLADIDYKQGLLDRLRVDNADLAERARNFQYNYENALTAVNEWKRINADLQRKVNALTNDNNRMRKILGRKPKQF